MNNNIVVTGGAGYIGSMACKLLKQHGYNPITVDNLSRGLKSLVKFGPFEQGDIGDIEFMDKVLKKYNPISVMHFAAIVVVSETVHNPYECYNNNVVATNNLLKAMLNNSLKNIVFSSTAAIFGGTTEAKVTENSTTCPITPYGKSKLMVENILDDYDTAYGLKSICLRYFNVTGADPELEVGSCSTPVTAIVPTMIEKILSNQEFTVFGNDYETKDGTCIRDYIHVFDLITAHIKAMEKLLTTNQSKKLNLGNGNGFSVKEMINSIENATNLKLKVKYGNRRIGDPVSVIADNAEIKKYLGWDPVYTSVEEQIKHSFLWYKKHNNVL
ncbi:UDP-glucose 4-epimerase GalE [Rickettsiales bacterium LUAb2]